ncbi:MAG: hypothetical protein K1X53_13080 [Candidatus Sumerlaeaceae bacterium]|nr:hypothetical protein [Candidatus Sumerlaeaceae bacterium]
MSEGITAEDSSRVVHGKVRSTRFTRRILRPFVPRDENVVWELTVRNASRAGLNDRMLLWLTLGNLVAACLLHNRTFGPLSIGMIFFLFGKFLIVLKTGPTLVSQLKKQETASDLLTAPISNETFSGAMLLFFLGVSLVFALLYLQLWTFMVVVTGLVEKFSSLPFPKSSADYSIFLLIHLFIWGAIWVFYWGGVGGGVYVIYPALFLIVYVSLFISGLFDIQWVRGLMEWEGFHWMFLGAMVVVGMVAHRSLRHSLADRARRRIFP